MELQDLLPIVITGGLIQLGTQLFFIYHCWNNPLLSDSSKVKYTVLLMFFNLPVAAFYLFSSYNKIKSKSLVSDEENSTAAKYLFQGIFILLLLAFTAFSINLLFNNSSDGNYVYILYLTSFSHIIFFILNSLKFKLNQPVSIVLSLLLIFAVTAVHYFAGDYNSLLIVLAVVAGLINYHERKNVIVLAVLTLILYIASEILRAVFLTGITDPDLLIGPFYVNIILIILVFVSFYNLKKYIDSNDKLTLALRVLKEQSLKIEEMSAIAERHKIAGEIHDNVGHELTTAIITIESGIKDLKLNSETAVEKFSRAGEIVRRSLLSIRNSVKTINADKIFGFFDELNILIDKVKADTNLDIQLINDTGSIELLPLQSKLLLQAIKECITNILKHSGSNRADIMLSFSDNYFMVSVSDDGKGISDYKFGFGLSSMKKNIESIGGTVFTDSAPGEGFSVHIKIPVKIESLNAGD